MRVEKPQADVNTMAAVQIDLGEVLLRLGLADWAHRAFERASAATSEEVLTRLAMQSFHHNLWQEAQDVLKRVVALHPHSHVALWNLAHAYMESWRLDLAEQTLTQAEAMGAQPGARAMRATLAGRLGEVDQSLTLYRELAEAQGPESTMRSSAAMTALYSDRLNAQQVAELHRSLFAGLGQGALPARRFPNVREAGKRIRLGLLSADFHHQHPVNIFMQPVLARLDKKQFEVTIYNVGLAHDDQTRLARSRVDHWAQATHWTPVHLARRMREDGMDVLVDLLGHTSNNRLPMLAQRVAPVQVSFLGYPGSTGVPNIDWMLADPVVVPPEHDALCSERVYRLPHTVFCYAPEVDYPYPDYNASFAERPLTFGSFNHVPKLTPHTIVLWAQVLARVPGSRLLLKAPSFRDESAIRVFRERFERRGVDPRRIEFRGPVGLTDMMAEYADVDIALDPVPYNGGTTTLQAMWMGVPVVVKEGQNFVSRMGASFMRAAGLPEWVAKNDAESLAWRDAFITTYLEKDIPALGPRIPATTLRRLWTMLAHNQGELLDQSRLASALSISGQSVGRYIDLLCDLMLVRRLPAWSGHVGKRLIRSPKVYVRDSGLVHALLGLPTLDAALSHPVAGASWEGFVIEQMICAAPTAQASFYRTSNGAEVDLVLEFRNGETWIAEIKRSSAPTVSKGFFTAAADLGAARKLLLAPVDHAYPMKEGVEVMHPLMAARLVSSK